MHSRSIFATVLIGIVLAASLLAATLAERAARAADSPRPTAWLGARLADVTPEECSRLGIDGGVRIVAIETGGPADEEGLLEGDIIVEFEGQPVAAAYEVQGMIRRMHPGELARVRVWRDGEERPISLVKLGAASGRTPVAGRPDWSAGDDRDLRERVTRLEQRVEALQQRVEELERAGQQ